MPERRASISEDESRGSGKLRLLIGALLGSLGLWLTLRDIPAASLKAVFFEADSAWVVAALLTSLLAVGMIVARWKLLLEPAAVTAGVLTRATLVGQMLNILIPFRVGELARVYGVARHTRVGVTRVMTSLAVEKALDLAIFGVASASLVAAALLPRTALSASRWLVMPATTAVALAVAFLFVRLRIGQRIAAWLTARGGVAARIGRLVASVVEGLDIWRSAGHAGAVLSWTVLIFVMAAATNAMLFKALGIAAPLSASFALLVVLQAGSVPPSLPGRLGIYNYLTVLTLGLYGVGRAEAASYSIVLYVVAYTPKLLLGGLVATDPSWRSFRKAPRD